MTEENKFTQLGYEFTNLGMHIRRTSHDLANVANLRNELLTELRGIKRNLEAIQARLEGVERNTSIRLTNSHNILGTSMIEYINVNLENGLGIAKIWTTYSGRHVKILQSADSKRKRWKINQN